jgi:hypothetical protein
LAGLVEVDSEVEAPVATFRRRHFAPAAAGFLLSLFGYLMACGSAPGGEQRKTKMNATSSGSQVCIGRYEFMAPGGLAIDGRTQRIYRVDVSTVSLAERRLQSYWNGKMAELRKLPSPPGTISPVLRTFELKPGMQAVWYADDPEDAESNQLLAIRPVGDHVVVAQRGGSVAGRSNVETLVGNVLDAYVPSTGEGFCAGAGAITTEPGRNEQTLIALTHSRLPDTEVEFSTETVREPDTSTYSDVSEEREAAAANGGTINVLRDRMRTAGGVEGNEMWISVSAPDEESTVRFTWEFAGRPENAIRPYMQFRASAPLAQKAELERLWEVLLNTLKPVPLPPKYRQIYSNAYD